MGRRGRAQNAKGGIITDPAAYLQNSFPGRRFELLADQSIFLEQTGDWLQRDYETRGGKSLSNCTLSAICNAMLFFARNGYEKIPGDPPALYQIVRKKARKYRILGRYGTVAFFNRMLANAVWRGCGYPEIRAQSKYFRGFSHWEALMKKRRPFFISLFSGKYARHTVCACGMLIFADAVRQYRFLAVYDNWSRRPRFLSDLEHYLSCTTQLMRQQGGDGLVSKTTK